MTALRYGAALALGVVAFLVYLYGRPADSGPLSQTGKAMGLAFGFAGAFAVGTWIAGDPEGRPLVFVMATGAGIYITLWLLRTEKHQS